MNPNVIRVGDSDRRFELALFKMVAECYYDPLAFVVAFFPWGVPGTPLEHFAGPDEWQRQELREIGRQVRLRAFNGQWTEKRDLTGSLSIAEGNALLTAARASAWR
jgi:hypothetical protein